MATSYASVEDAYKKKNKAIDDQIAADGGAYDAQRQDIKDSAADTLKQAYVQNERARVGMKQQQKAAGITGGATESSNVALQANYATNRTNTMLERDKQVSQVNIAQNQAKAQAEMGKAQNGVELATGKLAFEQSENQQTRSELWEFVRAGAITQDIANKLGYSMADLQKVYNYYKEK